MKLTSQYREKMGAAPGTLMHIGKENKAEIKLRVVRFDAQTYIDSGFVNSAQGLHACAQHQHDQLFTWVWIGGVHRKDTIEMLGQFWQLHLLTLEDIMNAHQRPKLERYPEYTYIVIRSLLLREKGQQLDNRQVSLIEGKRFVLFFEEEQSPIFETLLQRVCDSYAKFWEMGCGYLTYRILDTIVDHYFLAIEQAGAQIEVLEENLATAPTTRTLQSIQKLKKEVMLLRKAVLPLREVGMQLQHFEQEKPNGQISYLRDLYDHICQFIDLLESFKEISSDMLNVYMSTVSGRLQEVMKVLTIFSSLFAPLTFLAGVYGMNFSNMPELHYTWGYPAVLAVMLLTAASMLYYFRRKKWI